MVDDGFGWRRVNHLNLQVFCLPGSHLAKKKEGFPNMLGRTMGSHYGQVPKVAELALANVSAVPCKD